MKVLSVGFFKKLYHHLPKPLKTRRALIIGIILFVLYNILTRGSANTSLMKTESVETQTIRSEVVASGRVDSNERAHLHFAVAGRVASVLVSEGDTVQKGEVLATLDRERYEIALRQAEWSFQAAKAEFDKYYDGNRNNTDETFDERIDRTAIDEKHNNAYETLLKARRDVQDTVLRSPIDGTVTAVSVRVGEDVLPTGTAVIIANLGEIVFSSEIDETDIGRIDEGLAAKIVLDAFPDRSFFSVVSDVSLDATTTTTGATAYDVDFSLPDESQIRLGMNGESTILLSEVQNAVVVPFEALVDDTNVYVKVNGWYEKRKIKQGIASDTHIEVLDGLNQGDEILIEGFDEVEKKSLLDRLLRR